MAAMSIIEGTFGSVSKEVLSRRNWERALLHSTAHDIGNSHPSYVLFPDLRPVLLNMCPVFPTGPAHRC